MIQILGLRTFVNEKGVEKLYDAYHDKGWRAPDIYDLFLNAERYVEMIPKELRWNLYYTVANCTDEKRVFGERQDVIPIDIDGIDKGSEDRVVQVVCAELGLNVEDLGIVYSGNGVHILIGLASPITSATYINQNKVYYKALCGRVNQALFNAGMPGKADTTAFSVARILRLPFTKNIKKDKGETECRLIRRNMKPIDTDLYRLADMQAVMEGEHIHPKAYARLPLPDSKAVQEGCSFLMHCRTTEEAITEPEWYAMLSIVGRLEHGDKLIHKEYGPKGNKHIMYSPEAWDEKLKHALEASGPRTCANISMMHEGCQRCPHFNKITSPIQIVGEETIRTKESGFYEVVMKNGVPTKGKPCYDDLEKWFRKQFNYVSIEEDQTIMIYNGTHWEEMPELRIHRFAEQHFNPTPVTSMCVEFYNKLKRMNPVPRNEFNVEDKLNFQNGVLQLSTQILLPHSDEYKFTYCIPYAYEPKGDCPVFKKFLNDISCGDRELANLIAEYVGYCISGTDPELVQKCAILHGDGSNGKSVLISLMREMVGDRNCSAVGVSSIKKETHRYQLMNKLFNAAAESPSDAFLDSETFKDMVAGGVVEVRKLYGDPIMWKCTTKLMFACNDLPFNGDFSHGLYRRLLILPFNALFSDELGNKDPHMLSKLVAERSDVFKFCLDAFARTRERGYKFIEPAVVKQELEDFREMGDVVGRFIYTMCGVSVTLQNSQILPLDTVYNLFAMWCKENNQTLISYGSFSRRFGKAVTKRYPKVEKTRPRADDEARGTAYKYLTIKAVSAAVF
jgi:P4 family phage/plasmid primase-like protien